MNKLLILFFWSAICFGCKNNVTDEKKELTGEEKELLKLDNKQSIR